MSRYGSRKSFDLEWLERWARLVNDDRILPVVGRFFTNRFVLAMDEAEFLVEVRRGKVQRISEGLTLNDLGYDFALRAPAASWAKFAQQVPPPLFNHVLAMAHPLHGKLTIEGNHIHFWQNIRALHRMLTLMREV